MPAQRLAFLSYAHIDDDHSRGYLTQLCRALEQELRIQIPGDFRIFLDRDIKWGEEWADRIRTSLNEALFLIPIITPNYFQSEHCRAELQMFLEREQALSRTDLIYPIYFVSCDELEIAAERNRNPLARVIASRQYVNWRPLRFTTLRSHRARRLLAEIAHHLRDALRTHPGDAEFLFEEILAGTDGEKPFLPGALPLPGPANGSPPGSRDRPRASGTPAEKDSAGLLLSSWPDSLVEARSKHFQEEKRFLAEAFTPFLLGRIKRFVSEQRHVYLLIDSGTTLTQFFRELARQALRHSSPHGSWLDDVTIITNNLSGISSFVEHGRLEKENPFTRLVLNCRLLPGIPLPVYAAVTGSEKIEDPVLANLETQVVLARLRDAVPQTGEQPVFLSLLTGNWVRIRDTVPKCPVPLARGRGHREIKQALVNISDEAYVIAPLGKVFVGCSQDQVLDVLENTIGADEPSQPSYAEVKIGGDKATVVNLVTTAREPEHLLGRASNRLQELLEAQVIAGQRAYQSFVINKAEALPHLMFPYPGPGTGIHGEFEVEFPHEYTHTQDFLRLFHIGDDRIEQLGL